MIVKTKIERKKMKIQSINNNNNNNQNPNFGAFIVPNELVGRFKKILPTLDGDMCYFTSKDLIEEKSFHHHTGKALEIASKLIKPNHTLFINYTEKMRAANFVLLGGIEGSELMKLNIAQLFAKARNCTEETLTALESKMQKLTESGESEDSKLGAMLAYELNGTL